MSEKTQEKAVKTSYLFQFASAGKKAMLALAVFLSVLAGFAAFVPYLMIFKTILLIVEGNVTAAMGIRYGLIALVSIVLRFLLQAVSMVLTHWGAYALLYDIRAAVCEHIGKVELGFFDQTSTGQIKKVLMEETERLEAFFAHEIPDIAVAAAVPTGILIYLFHLNGWMALALLAPILITVLIQLGELAIASPMMRRASEVIGRCNLGILEYVNGMSVMKAYNQTAESFRGYAQAIGEYNDLWVSLSRILAPMSGVMKTVIESGVFFVLPLGGYFYLRHLLTLSDTLFFLVMSVVFLASYNNLMNFAQIFSQISSGLTQIKAIMDQPEIASGEKRALFKTAPQIAWENVSFAYQEKMVLRDISLIIPSGSLTAFVGPSGAGKTTCAQLLLRFWPLKKGRITINNEAIENYSEASLMSQIAFVFQDDFMLKDTIYENIAMGRKGCTDEEVIEAAKAAEIHDFIMQLPDRYQTRIEEGGIRLSGGERQRIAIARAILKDAPIVVFDEATSFADLENEARIQRALNRLLKGKTVIMIAHRLHTITGADQICVFEDGALAECGTHETLLKKNGLYRKMWESYEGGKEDE